MEWLFGKPMTPEEMLRKNQRALNKAMRDLDREKNRMEQQEKKIIEDIKKMAKAGQMVSGRFLLLGAEFTFEKNRSREHAYDRIVSFPGTCENHGQGSSQNKAVCQKIYAHEGKHSGSLAQNPNSAVTKLYGTGHERRRQSDAEHEQVRSFFHCPHKPILSLLRLHKSSPSIHTVNLTVKFKNIPPAFRLVSSE